MHINGEHVELSRSPGEKSEASIGRYRGWVKNKAEAAGYDHWDVSMEINLKRIVDNVNDLLTKSGHGDMTK